MRFLVVVALSEFREANAAKLVASLSHANTPVGI